MKRYLEDYRPAGADWYVHEPEPETQTDENGRKYVVLDKSREHWVPADSKFGREIAAVLGE